MPKDQSSLLVSESFIEQPSGHRLCIQHYGAANLDRAVIFLHGFPGSRLQAGFAAQWARDLDCALITYDRPGFGLSDVDRARTLHSSTDHVRLIADHLGLSTFSLFAVSGGVPHALVTAAVLGDRVVSLGLVSGLGPDHSWAKMRGAIFSNRVICALSTLSMPVAASLVKVLALWWARRPAHLHLWFRTLLRGADRAALSGETGRFLVRDVREALRQGAAGAEREFRILLGPWGLDFSAITAPTLLWHGAADRYLPPSMTLSLASLLSNAKAEVVPGAGHFLVVSNGAKMLAATLAAGSALNEELSVRNAAKH